MTTALVDALLRHVAALPGLRADRTGEPVVLRVRDRPVARLWRDTAVLEVALPPEAAAILTEVELKYHDGPATLRVALLEPHDLDVAIRLLDRRLNVEHFVSQYVQRSP